MEEKIELDEISHLALQFISNTSRHVFLTGKAGTGKTTLLKHIFSKTHKKTVIAAPTGIAAINAGGVTLHSLFQLPFGAYVPSDFSLPFEESNQKIHTPASLAREQRLGATKRQLLREIELLIIDEVSMLRADLLDAIDMVLKKVRRNPHLAFGGVQVLFIGDLYQLPPVVKRDEMSMLHEFYSSMYFFDAQVLKNEPPIYLELETVHRQSDQQFIDLLNRIRDQEMTEEDQYLLQEHYAYDGYLPEDEGHIFLTTHNAKANKINEEKLASLPADSISFTAKVTGKFDLHLFPNEETLTLKEGAQVMFIKNDPTGQQRFYNGKIGTVSDLSEKKITVSIDSETIVLERFVWENVKYKVDPSSREIEEELVGEFAQYPVKLAWAVTVHKSQGLTFEKAILDLEEAFAPGQFYVAMSRLTNLNGLTFASEVPRNSFLIDSRLQDFSQQSRDTEQLSNQLLKDQRSYILDLCARAFDFRSSHSAVIELIKEFERTQSLGKEDELWKTVVAWDKLLSSWSGIGERFSNEIFQIGADKANEYLKVLATRVEAGYDYFKPTLTDFCDEIISVGHKKPYKSIKEFQEIWKDWYQEISSKGIALVRAKAMTNHVTKNQDTDPLGNLRNEPDFIFFSKPYKPNRSPDTKAQTLAMYQEGMKIEEIVEKRQLAPGTIYSHLAHYVSTGELNAFDFVGKKKVTNILTVAVAISSKKLSEIKAKLGDEYSYEDIRIALAHDEFELKIK
ncbi:MAG: helix-turn-helix domain-containing protein [Cyclobacteriaceae bacterium]